MSEINNPAFARFYAHVLEPLAAHDRNRRRLMADLEGEVLELGCGAGVNFALYPSGVTGVIAVEPEPYLRERARQAALSAGVDIVVLDGHADEVPLEGASVDAVVCSLVLCSVPDQARTLAELRRVLRPSGLLHYYEHVVAHGAAGRALQRAVDATFWPHAFGNCHTARDTEGAIAEAGFEIERTRRIAAVAPPFPHVLGVARAAERTGDGA